MNAETLKDQIRTAFAGVDYPGDWCLRGSSEGEEPYLLEREFAGRNEWQSLSTEFLDNAPDGYASARSFFSDEALRFYLPAYLVADIEGKLASVTPVFYLTHGLDNRSKDERVNPRRYGERTWFEATRHRFSVFDRSQAAAIVAYLEFKQAGDEFERERIDQALMNYWRGRM
jgi:hypothetical protein